MVAVREKGGEKVEDDVWSHFVDAFPLRNRGRSRTGGRRAVRGGQHPIDFRRFQHQDVPEAEEDGVVFVNLATRNQVT